MSGDSILKSLNKAQCQAVTSQASTVAILAGPGSGKTHTLTSRVVWLVDHVGHQPCDIIVATFTVKAAREMKARIGKALDGGRERKIILGTFHSIARRYLAAYGQKIGLDQKFAIADDSDSRGIITRICKRLDVKIDPPAARAWISKKKAKGTSGHASTSAKNGQKVESRAFETCYEEYQKHLERSNLLDYDDLLVRCVELLRSHPSCVSNVQAVLIDEYQDTNGVQYELMKLFAQQHSRITIVGDPDQSIYGWRSAEIENLRRFLRDFNRTDEISLEENYRSTSYILDTSLKVIQQDETRYQKALLPVHNKGTRPVLRKLKNPFDEADWIVSEIKRVKMMSGDMINFNDVAILLRSAALSRHIESSLGRAGMAYKMVGGFKFYERVEVKIVLDYLRVIHQPENNDALARIINVPKRGVGDTTIKALLEEAERGSMSLWTLLDKHCRGDRAAKTTIRKQTEQKISGELLKLIKGLQSRIGERTEESPLNLVDLIERLLRDLHFEQFLQDTHGEDYESRWSNVQEFVSLAGEFMRDQSLVEDDNLPEIAGFAQVHENDVLARFLANVSLASDKQTDDQEAGGKPHITVSTIHAAKGLEWPVVFIPAVYKGSIPHMRSDDEPEERRLLYVAMTRAQALLYLSCPVFSSSGSGDGLQMSPFIEDLSLTAFINKGPSFDRAMLMEVARVLKRDLPSDATIYQKLPMMTAVEDNLFPVDPNDPKQYDKSSNQTTKEAHRGKRQKTYHTSSTSNVNPESVEGWNTPYATTMQRPSSFTLPGFTTAGAQHAIAAAEQKPLPTNPTIKKPPRDRLPAQRSLLSYVVKDHDQSKTGVDSGASLMQQTFHRVPHPQSKSAITTPKQIFDPSSTIKQEAVIDPGLTLHKLTSAKMPSKPPPVQKKEQVSGNQYTCFSSSPSKPSPEKPAPSQEDIPPLSEQVRPASCFHATTVGLPSSGFKGLKGLKKPAGLGRDGISPMDRLRKPFKPVTMNGR